MIDLLSLARLLAPYRVIDDAQMPPAYRQGARSTHDDWSIGGLPQSIQPWTRIPRKWTAYRLPMPSFRVDGNAKPEWVPLQEGYPVAPGAQIEDREWWDGERNVSVVRPHILTMEPAHPIGQWSVQGVYINGEIVPCYKTASFELFGKRLYYNYGLRPDVTYGDFLWWFPEASLTWR